MVLYFASRCSHSFTVSFRPMSCSPGIILPRLRVASPGLRVHPYTYVCGRLSKNEEYPPTFFACLFVLDSSLDRSELDLIFYILRSSRKRLRQNNFILRANQLSVQAKRLRANRTLGETTCFLLEIRCKSFFFFPFL